MFGITCFDSQGNSVNHLTQWDLNQTLYIYDWNYDENPIFHFCNKNSDKALVVTGEVNSGVASVNVPNALLEEPYPIIAYIFLYSDAENDGDFSGKTMHTIKIPVKARTKPDDYEYEDNYNKLTVSYLNERISNMIQLLSSDTTATDISVELQDIRVGFDGTVYDTAGEAVRQQAGIIPNQATLNGNKIEFYRQVGDTSAFLFDLDVTVLLESGLSLENLELAVEKTNNSAILHMSDGENDKSIAIPMEVDSVLSLSSTNPVQNRVITEQINYVIEEIENIKENGIGGGEGVTVRLTNQNGTSTLVGSHGSAVSLMFTFTSTENDLPTGNANLKITVNSVQKVNMSIPQGLTSIDVAPYLNIGSNTVIVTCTDIYGKSRSLSYDVTIVKLSISSTFNDSITYDGDILFKYTPTGSIEKTIHFIVDGREVGTVITSLSGKQMTRTFPKMEHGSHLIEVYSSATLNDTYMESPKLAFDVMCVEAGDTTPMIASVYQVDSIMQGELISIPFIVFDPSKLSCDITRTIFTKENGSEIIFESQDITVDRAKKEWNTRNYPRGEVYFRIQYGEISKTHKVIVTQSSITVTPETNDLELSLSSEGRSNNETNPAKWEYNDITTTFENMNWNSVGWVADEHGDSCLRLNGDAVATINFKPFAEDIRTYGKTIELEFVIRDVNNRVAVPISCMSGGIGFEVMADTARLKSEQSEVFCNYKEEERVHLAFVIESKDEYRLLSVYLNGVMSDAIQYPASDNFQQLNPVNISIGSPYCGVDLYKVRSYTTALTDSSLANNYIADISDVIRKTEAFEDNDIYDEFGQISFTKAREKNSTMIIVGDLPTYKGDKKTCSLVYYDVEDSNLDFADDLVSIDVQGTSSQWYVRKNWKLKTPNEHHIDIDQLPGKVICIKVDYAEATGTHNTQNAVFVEKLYSEKIPPQEDNPKVRTTIYGKPILLFHQAYEGAEPVFYGKANFNWDKGAENVFGFTSDYDVECWEFCNNTSDACLFQGEVPSDFGEDFEARYPDKYKNINRFKAMHDWVLSTKQSAATGRALSSSYIDVDGNTHTHDTAEYRLAKFKTEFEDLFNMHYSLIYYVYTFFALMVDQRAKNMFLTYWGKTRQWYPYFYDNDTCFGINNEGGLSFDYFHEDIDQVGGANVYNGQNSTLWVNFRQAFPDLIKETYQDLRSNSVLNYEELIYQFITHGSDKWSESVYNEDGDFKYISMLRSDNDATNLPQVRGTGEEHLRYFIENRLNYCDSKWYAGSYPEDNAVVRIYTPVDENGVPRTDLAIPANANITVTPYSAMYAGVRYKANGTLYQERLEENETYTFLAPNETFNDTETAIYGASQLSSLGDLAPLYLGYIDVGAATKLVELKIGDGTPGYQNANLYHLAVGTNRLLKKIDIQNCIGFNHPLVLSGCPNIEEVYAKGSAITGVELPDSGYLKVLQLPATISNLTLKNQLYIEDFSMEGYNSLKTVQCENCPSIDTLTVLNNAPNVERVRLTNVDWEWDDASVLYELIERDIAGIDENGVNTDTMWIDGKCKIKNITGAEFAEIKRLYPYLELSYETLTSNLIFMSDDGETELHRQVVLNEGNGVDPVANGTIETPTKESTAQYHFTYSGWSTTPGGDAELNALTAVAGDRIVYAAYTKAIRSYTVNFYNGSTLLETDIVEYGKDAVYNRATPVKEGYTTKEFEFIGWKPEPTNIQGDTNCYAQYYDKREITDDWATIAINALAKDPSTKYDIGAYKPVVFGGNKLPYNFYNGGAIVYNNEIHLLGGGDSSSQKKHHKWNGNDWVELGELPFSFNLGYVILYHDEIHVLSSTLHYKFNLDNGWSQVSTIPYSFYNGAGAVVYNDEIHILGSGTHHYKYSNNEWIEVGALPYRGENSGAVVYNNKIHFFGGTHGYTNHYSFDGTNWTNIGRLPYSFRNGIRIVYNNELHLIGSLSGYKHHYKFDGTNWTNVCKLPFMSHGYSGAIVYNNEIHVLGSEILDYQNCHHYFDGNGWNVLGEHEIIDVEVAGYNHDELADNYRWTDMGSWSCDWQVAVHNGKMYSAYHGNCWCFDGTTVKGVSGFNGTYGTKMISYQGKLHAFPYHGSTENGYNIHYILNESTYTWERQALTPMQSSNPYYIVFNDLLYAFGGESGFTKTYYTYDGTTWTHIADDMPSSTKNVACVYNDVVHFIFDKTKHYTFDGTTWTFIGTLPFEATNSSMVVYNDRLHIWGCASDKFAHYEWNGSYWVLRQDKLQYQNSAMCVLNNRLYACSQSGKILRFEEAGWMDIGCSRTGVSGRAAITYHDAIYGVFNKGFAYWKHGNSQFTHLLNVPYHYALSLCVFDDEIHILCSPDSGSTAYHYKYIFDSNEWVEVSTLPANEGMYRSTAIVYNNLLYYMTNNKGYYIYDGVSWSDMQTYPDTFTTGSPLVVYNGELHTALGSGTNTVYHYKFDGSVWTKICDTPYYMRNAKWIVNNGELYSMGGHCNQSYWYKFNGTEWINTGISLPFSDTNYVSYRNKLYAVGMTSKLETETCIVRRFENPKAPLTFIARQAYPETQLFNNDNNSPHWNTSTLRTWCNGNLFNSLPDSLQSVIRTINKVSDTGYSGQSLEDVEDRIWVPSVEELGLESDNIILGQGEPYSVFTDNASRQKACVNTDDIVAYHTRSAVSSSSSKIFYINIGGSASEANANSSNLNVVFGFCI